MEGANTYTGATNIESGTLIAANSSGSVTGTGAVTVQQNATLKISGLSAVAGGAGGTTINAGGTLLLNGGTLAGALNLQSGAFLRGQGTLSGTTTINGTIGGDSNPQNLKFTGNVTMSKTTIFDWRLNALDATPVDAGIDWSLLSFTGPSIQLGSSGNAVNFTIDFPASLPDPDSGNIFWEQSHQWLIITASSPSWNIWYNSDFPAFLQGSFSLPSTISSPQISISYTPYAAATTTWNSPTGGSWSLTSNWFGNLFAKHVGDTANFTNNFSAPSTVTLDDSWTLGTINFHSNNPLTIVPGTSGSLTLNNAANSAAINNTSGSLTISAPINLYSATTIQTSNSTDSISLLGPVSGSGGLTVSGPGTLTLGGINSYQGSTTIKSGTLMISTVSVLPASTSLSIGTNTTPTLVKLVTGTGAPNTLAIVLKVASLSIASASVLDVTNHDLIIGNSNVTTIETEILNGFGDGPGGGEITSSTAIADGNKFLVPIDATTFGITEWDNVPVTDPNSVIVKYTYFGDINLDGQVDAGDYATLDGFFGPPAGPGGSIVGGDADLSGVVDAGDYAFLDNFFGDGVGNPLVAVSPNNVPEPVSLTLLSLGATIMIVRRRKPRTI